MEDNEKNTFEQENSDDFGLPEVKYEPIEREEEDLPEFEEPQYYEREEEVEEEEEDDSKKGLIIFGIIAVVLVAGLSIYLFLFGGVEQVSGWFADDPEPEPVTEVVEPEPEPEPIPEPEPEPEPEIDPLAPYSDISTISAPSGRSFIVVGSFVDEDLARDFSNELMGQEIGSRILAPTDRAPLMHRVAVADYETFDEAMNEVTLFRNKYGDQTWVLKY